MTFHLLVILWLGVFERGRAVTIGKKNNGNRIRPINEVNELKAAKHFIIALKFA